MSRIVYLLWSNKHNAWWAPNSLGYTDDMAKAGRYSETDAIHRVVQSAQSGDRNSVTCMVAAPDNWLPITAERVEGILTLLNDPNLRDPFHYVIRLLPELVDGTQRWNGGWIFSFELIDGTVIRREMFESIADDADNSWSVKS